MSGRIDRKEYISSIPQLENLAGTLGFDINKLFIDQNFWNIWEYAYCQ